VKAPGEYRSDDGKLRLLGWVFPSRPCPVSEAFAPYLPVRLKHKIKGRSRSCVRPAHKAPQCGAFQGIANRRRFDGFTEQSQSVIRQSPVFAGLCGDFDRHHRKERENMDDNKKSTTIWLRPSVISRMDGWLEADNCQSRSEFVDKALRFYMGYLGTEDNTAYLSKAILTAIQGTLDDNNNRLCRILFKCAVELNMLCHTIAAHFRADPIHTRELRAYAVDEVKRTNGQVSFESAVRQQRRIEYEEDEEMGGF